MAGVPTKRPLVRIGTHSGSFHCDEALGCWMLQHTPQFKDADIVRSRDQEVLKDLDVVIDVGGVYDATTNRFDHHQRGFSEVFGHGFNTKLSSAGLVYKHYGKQVVAGLLGLPEEHPDVATVFLRVYKTFIEAVDAIDNGINQWDGDAPPKYLNYTHLAARVGQLNPNWNEPSGEEVLQERFLQAVELTGKELAESVLYTARVWLPGRSYVIEALQKRKEYDAGGQIMVLSHYCPWKEHLYELEVELAAELQIESPILFCVYEDDREKKWRVQAVSVGPGSFENRKGLATAWRGLRDEELSALSGIPGCVFVHASGFIGGNATLEGALRMAQLSLVAE